MTLREISEYDCVNGECPLDDKCLVNAEPYHMGFCDMALELLKVMEEEG